MADALGVLDLLQGRTGVPDREEQFGFPRHGRRRNDASPCGPPRGSAPDSRTLVNEFTSGVKGPAGRKIHALGCDQDPTSSALTDFPSGLLGPRGPPGASTRVPHPLACRVRHTAVLPSTCLRAVSADLGLLLRSDDAPLTDRSQADKRRHRDQDSERHPPPAPVAASGMLTVRASSWITTKGTADQPLPRHRPTATAAHPSPNSTKTAISHRHPGGAGHLLWPLQPGGRHHDRDADRVAHEQDGLEAYNSGGHQARRGTHPHQGRSAPIGSPCAVFWWSTLGRRRPQNGYAT